MQDRAVQSFCLAATEQLRPDRQASGSAVDCTLSDHGSHGERAHSRRSVRMPTDFGSWRRRSRYGRSVPLLAGGGFRVPACLEFAIGVYLADGGRGRICTGASAGQPEDTRHGRVKWPRFPSATCASAVMMPSITARCRRRQSEIGLPAFPSPLTAEIAVTGSRVVRPGPTAARRMSGKVSVPPYRKAARNPSVPASRQMPASAAATSGGSIHLASARSARRRPLAAMMAGPGRQIERFRCSYGLNHEYLEVLTANGLRFSGSGDTGPVRIAERPGHPFFPGHPGPARTARRRHPPAPDHRRPCRRGG